MWSNKDKSTVHVELKQTECEYRYGLPHKLAPWGSINFISQDSKLSPMAVCMTEFFCSFDDKQNGHSLEQVCAYEIGGIQIASPTPKKTKKNNAKEVYYFEQNLAL